jgi:hypothetical protein
MILGYRGQNTLAGGISAGVGFFGALVARTLIGAALLVSEVETELLSFQTVDHETVVANEVELIFSESKRNFDEASPDDYSAAEAEAKTRVGKLSLDEVHQRAVKIRFAEYEKPELIEELANHEHHLDVDEVAQLEVRPEQLQETREKLSSLNDNKLRERFAEMELAHLRSRVADMLTARVIDETKLERDAEQDKIRREMRERVSGWAVAPLLRAERENSAKDNAEVKRSFFIIAALYEMLFSFGFGGWVSLLLGTVIAYKVGCGDWLMR